jgi:EmrB/QacA subfamily drug resistance transporter
MTVLDLFIVNVAFPNMLRDFAGTSLASLSWVLNGYAIIYAALLVAAGRLADRNGQKLGFLIGVGLFTASSLLCAAAPDPTVLIIGRLLQAAGAAAVLPTSLALILNAVPAERRTWAIGVWSAIVGLAAAAGPTIGGLLVNFSWRWVFLVNLPIGIGALVFGVRYLTESNDEHATAWPDLLGAAVLTAGVGAVSLGLVKGPDWGWESARVIGAFVLAVVAIAWFARRSAHHPSPIVEPELLRNRAFAVSAAAAFLFNAAFSIWLLGCVQHLTDDWGYSALRVGLAIAPGPIMATLISTQIQAIVQRFGARASVGFGTFAFALASFDWQQRLGADHAYLSAMLPGMLVAGIGYGLTMPVIITTAVRGLPRERYATGNAVVSMARQLGSVLGISLLVVLLSNGKNLVDAFADGWLIMGLAGLATGIIFVAGVGRSPVVAAPVEAVAGAD